jgi:uncharacterized membrane protein
MKNLLRSSIYGIGIGAFTYLIFVVAVLGEESIIFSYPLHGNAFELKVIWMERMFFEKVLNLIIIALAGIIIPFFVKRSVEDVLVAAGTAAVFYQIIGIGYVIYIFGFKYYIENHVVLDSFIDSILSCGLFAYTTFSILRWRRNLKQISEKSLGD